MQYESLLFDLKPEEIEQLIWEEQLRQDGWEVYYAIDPAEIRDYCFPFGFDQEEFKSITDKKSKSFIADEHLLLVDLLGRPMRDTTRTMILLKDYFEEVNGLIRYSIQQANNLPMQGEKVFQEFFFGQNSEGGKDLGEYKGDPEHQGIGFVQSHFSEALASALMLRNGTEELANLLQKGLISTENNIQDDEDLLDALTVDIDEPLLEENKLLQRLDSLAQNKKLKKFSKRRDVRVIGRLITANQHFIRTNQKRIFFCFTDAEISVALLRDLYESEDIHAYPIFGNIPKFPLYRKRRHLFAQMLCKGAVESHEIVIKNLNTLHQTTEEFRTELIKIGYNEQVFFSVAAREILERYTKLRNQFENENLVRHYENTLNEALAIAKQKNADKARELIERIQVDLPGIINRLSGFEEQMRFLVDEHRFNVAFTRGVNDLEKKQGKFNLSKGADPVEGSYHHLPTVFWLGNNHQRQIKSIANFVLGRNSENEILSGTLKNIIRTLNKEKIYTHEEKLIKAYIYLILPKTDHNDDNNRISLDWIKSILHQEKDNMTPLLQEEFKYLAVWAARRAGQYSDSLQFAQQEIGRLEREKKQSANLARFYHGRFLTNYCLYEIQKAGMEQAERVALLRFSIGDCILARRLYENLKASMKDIKDKLQSTLLNSLCFLYTELYVEEKNPEHLVTARNYLKTLRDPAPDNYKRFPEYLHTESYLEYYESYVPKGDQLFKLQMALQAIDGALRWLNTADSDLRLKYEDLREKIIERQRMFNR